MLKNNYREVLLKKISRIKKITFGMIGFCIAFMIAGLCILFYYSYKTDITADYSIYSVLFGLCLFIIVGILLRSFFKSYNEVINEMNNEDLETLEKLGESRSWTEKSLPSFIVYSGKIRVFKLYHQPDFYFTDLTEISIRPNNFTRSRQNQLVIFKKSKGGSYFFGIDSNYLQRNHLIDKAIEYNPKIIIKNR
ncbi:hypothetical protein [Chryseobacterium gregarium]|uniref:hypothetical protein n=1 Tax=Chryseobacterium gregarium TaxID=456299 RepID=UPI000415782E|nr:hypothetical protein [Chryseobacterium gregarium]